jgi:hypothetical protein
MLRAPVQQLSYFLSPSLSQSLSLRLPVLSPSLTPYDFPLLLNNVNCTNIKSATLCVYFTINFDTFSPRRLQKMDTTDAYGKKCNIAPPPFLNAAFMYVDNKLPHLNRQRIKECVLVVRFSAF